MKLVPRTIYDSVILIDFLKNDKAAVARLRADTRRAISVVTRTEVLAGTRHEHEHMTAIALIEACENILVSEDIADLAAELRKQFRLMTADAIIYATAKMLGAKLVTRDKAFPDEVDVVHV
jgi:predicted nucleic acid-binding protein